VVLWQSSLEIMVMNRAFWKGKRVFVTGHTGFKGGWLCLWLHEAGANVYGFALEPPTRPSLFVEAKLQDLLSGHAIGDIRDPANVLAAMQAADPEIVFHLAAQPLVRHSYAYPADTFATNVMGTVHVLDAARQMKNLQAVINVTTDKCYDNKEWHWGYREGEALGGKDPYSSSKACSELVTAAYRASYFRESAPYIASARAGNVIGGGDWAVDRLLPDIFRALISGETLQIRYPSATRPWQHVLEPLSGYLTLAEKLVKAGASFATAWNFGPADCDARPVSWILSRVAEKFPDLHFQIEVSDLPHEAGYLKLDSSKAIASLNWSPRWSIDTAIGKTVEWHQSWRRGDDMQKVCSQQITAFEAASLI
jgi:CDP-glucose 4,6-dehydratase